MYLGAEAISAFDFRNKNLQKQSCWTFLSSISIWQGCQKKENMFVLPCSRRPMSWISWNKSVAAVLFEEDINLCRTSLQRASPIFSSISSRSFARAYPLSLRLIAHHSSGSPHESQEYQKHLPSGGIERVLNLKGFESSFPIMPARASRTLDWKGQTWPNAFLSSVSGCYFGWLILRCLYLFLFLYGKLQKKLDRITKNKNLPYLCLQTGCCWPCHGCFLLHLPNAQHLNALPIQPSRNEVQCDLLHILGARVELKGCRRGFEFALDKMHNERRFALRMRCNLNQFSPCRFCRFHGATRWNQAEDLQTGCLFELINGLRLELIPKHNACSRAPSKSWMPWSQNHSFNFSDLSVHGVVLQLVKGCLEKAYFGHFGRLWGIITRFLEERVE